ncbi:hypothetical protein H072_1122 [Dactylellina haptotyla CBS 200.50]|uniref:Uncharacterized protein n=1 Tax=Dactylellina haptotyla (strain CBS 200.50) TaxID=1284197 RepID=S8APL5_DACHA|nr:hypothetical protein H072_1122 [Dactylellina haptotyla CBS 200.50]
MKVSFIIASAAIFAAAHSLAVIDPARTNACKRPMDDGCAQLCKKCMPANAAPTTINQCFDTSKFDKLCIPPPPTPAKYKNIDCDKVTPKDPKEVLKGECAVLCKFAKKSNDWKEFEEHCKN